MSTIARRKKVADSYLKLVLEFPLRPIRNDKDCDQAFSVIQRLALRGEDDLDAGEHDYLAALSCFVSLYTDKHYPLPGDQRTPAQRLEYTMSQSGTTPVQLHKILGCSQSLVSMILSGSRQLSKANIKLLAAYFKLDAGYFL